MNNKKNQVIIIGAGLGGLCCGALLAKHGFEVTIVEQHNIPGGYATSFKRAGGKYIFDVSLHYTSINSELLQVLEELGITDQVELVKVADYKRIITPVEDMRFSNNKEEKIDFLSERYPDEKENIKNYFTEMQGISDELELLKQDKGVSDFPEQYPKLWAVKDKSLEEFMAEYIKDNDLKDFLSMDWGSIGLPPSKASAFYYSIASLSSGRGQYYTKNRSQDLSNAFVKALSNYGGKIIYRTLVEKIIVENNNVSGIITYDGKQIPGNIVISNASAVTTLKEMLPDRVLPLEYLNKLDTYNESISTFNIWLGLNTQIINTIKDSRILVLPVKNAEENYKSAILGKIEKLPFNIIIYDNYFNNYSKPGTSTIAITALSSYKSWEKYAAGYKAGDKSAYKKEKDRWTGILLQKIEEKVIPGLSSMIEVAEAATPLTNRRYTMNTKGAVYGFEQSVSNTFMSRIDNRTPVRGLYLAGAWGNPGGGYAGVLAGGERTYKQVIEDWI